MKSPSTRIIVIVMTLMILVKPHSQMPIPPYATTGLFGAGIGLGALVGSFAHVKYGGHAGRRVAKVDAK